MRLEATRDGQATLLHVRVQPRASRRGVTGTLGGELRIALHAPPAGGAANRELRELLAELFGLSPSSVELLSGHSARSKRVLLVLTPDDARRRLARLIE